MEIKVRRNLELSMLRSILVEIESYKAGRSPFSWLVSSLDVGIDSLYSRESEFVFSLRKQWRILEEINAVALDQGGSNPLEADIAAAEAAIREFEDSIRVELSRVDPNESSELAALLVDALLKASIICDEQIDLSVKVVTEEIEVQKALGRY